MTTEAKKKGLATASAVEAAQVIDGRQTDYRIEGARGLVLTVYPSGSASYFCRYSIQQAGRQLFRRVRLGDRLDRQGHGISLADARKKATDIIKQVNDGHDPAAAVVALKKGTTLRELWEMRRKLQTERSPRTMDYYADALQRDVFPLMGDRPVESITTDEFAVLLTRVELRSKHSAHACRCALGSTYRWAFKRRQVKSNPLAGLGFTVNPAEHIRERVASPSEMERLWRGLGNDETATEAMRIVLKLVILTGQRETEVVGAKVSEVVLDVGNPLWRISRGRMKNKKREQVVPLSEEAAALFAGALEIGGERTAKTGYVFPASLERVKLGKEPRTPHMHRQSVGRAMARICEAASIKGLHVHDMRKGLTTWLREDRREREDVIEAILHHSQRGARAHYDFATLEKPVRAALQDWANYVTRLGSGHSASVTKLARVTA